MMITMKLISIEEHWRLHYNYWKFEKKIDFQILWMSFHDFKTNSHCVAGRSYSTTTHFVGDTTS